MSEAGAVPAEGGQVEAPAGPDLGPLMDRMDQIAGSVEDLGARIPEQEQEPEQGFQQQGWPPAQQYQQQQPYGQMYGQQQPQQFQGFPQQQPGFGQPPVPGMLPVADEYGNIDQAALSAYLQSVPQMTAAGLLPQVQEMLKPVLDQFHAQSAQLAEERMDRGFQSLEQEFSALQDLDTAKKVMGRVAEVAASLGQDPNEACRNPGFVRLIYLSDMASQNGGQGQQPEGRQPELEQGGGAAPGGSNGNDWVSHVRGQRDNADTLNFWGVSAT